MMLMGPSYQDMGWFLDKDREDDSTPTICETIATSSSANNQIDVKHKHNPLLAGLLADGRNDLNLIPFILFPPQVLALVNM